MIKTHQLEDVVLEYALTGEGFKNTILFVHGLGANCTQFENQNLYFSKHFKVVSVTLRGHGNSTLIKKNTGDNFNLDKISTDILLLLDKLQIQKVHYVGNSMGGNVGYHLLKLNVNRLLSFTTFGTTAKLKTSVFTTGMIKFAYKLMGIKMIANLAQYAGQTKYSKKKIKTMLLEMDKHTLLDIIPQLGNFDFIDVIASTVLPVLIIKGEKDKEINKVIDGYDYCF